MSLIPLRPFLAKQLFSLALWWFYINTLDFLIFLLLTRMFFLCIQDLHCHLTTGEVVGYLGGRWDRDNHGMDIHLCFPS